jgi:hypothetical protein
MPGKFEGNENEEIAEILYNLWGEGGADEESGSIQERGIASAIFRGIEVYPEGDTRRGADDEPFGDGYEGGYIVEEDSQGFVTYTEFEDTEKMEKAWEWILEQDAEFSEEEPDDETDPDYDPGYMEEDDEVPEF